MILVRQETDWDCCAAVVAMIMNVSLNEAKSWFPVDFTKEGICIQDVQCFLSRKGFWIRSEFAHWCNLRIQNERLKPKGFGFAQVEFKGGWLHLVAVNENNEIYDPVREAPCSIDEYDRINSVYSVLKICSSTHDKYWSQQ